MAMVVNITNITDASDSKKSPTRLAIYTTHLDPGEELKLPAAMVDARLKTLETQGYIAIGQVPSWYAASKAKKLGRKVLSPEEVAKRLQTPVAAPKEAPPAAPDWESMAPKKKDKVSVSEESKTDKK